MHSTHRLGAVSYHYHTIAISRRVTDKFSTRNLTYSRLHCCELWTQVKCNGREKVSNMHSMNIMIFFIAPNKTLQINGREKLIKLTELR